MDTPNGVTRGRYIAIEGPDGAGKTTQVNLLTRRLIEELGIVAQFVREPGGDPVAERLRSLVLTSDQPIAPLAEAAMFSAARANMLATVVEPLLNQGVWVISDRSSLSSLVYQGFGQGLDSMAFRQAITFFASPLPDIEFILSISLETGVSRRASRGQSLDRMESQDDAFKRRVNEGYAYFSRFANTTINGNRDEGTVAEEIWLRVCRDFDLE